MRRRRLSHSVGALVALAATPAFAEFNSSVTIESDDRFRGQSVSFSRPVASLDLTYDDPSGAYAGVTGTAVAQSGPRLLGLQAYAGYFARLVSGQAVDLGVTHSYYPNYYGKHIEAEYSEAYTGLITQHFSSHIFYSPHYFGSRDATVYGEVDSTVHPWRNWRLSGHVGVLRVTSGPTAPGGDAWRPDWRIGLSTSIHSFDLQLAWTGRAAAAADRYPLDVQSRQALVIGVTRGF